MKKIYREYSVELLSSPNIFPHDFLFPGAGFFFFNPKIFIVSDGGQWGWWLLVENGFGGE